MYVSGWLVFTAHDTVLFSPLLLYLFGPVTFTCPPVFPVSFAFKFLLIPAEISGLQLWPFMKCHFHV